MKQLYNRQNSQVAIWLGVMCFAIICMIFIGGITRLTDSGLSITEWKPVSGILPPLDQNQWEIEFKKYQESPEYIKHNFAMVLSEFKSIYWIEFIHRIAGRITSLLYILPLVFFFIKGSIKGKETIYIGILFLLIMQGIMGWYMVKSGLISAPHVSHYRLAVHLIIAVFIYSSLFWQMMRNSFSILLVQHNLDLSKISVLLISSITLLFVQILLGALVAGLSAGLVYNNFPYMGDSFIPSEVMIRPFGIDSFNQPVFVQFIHRITAYVLFILISILCICGAKLRSFKFSMVMGFIFFSLLLQILTGIMTLIYVVPIPLALLHQLGAILLLSCLLWALFLIKSVKDSIWKK